jgi:amino acid transporter
VGTTVPPVGVWLGWLLTSAYAMASILQPVMFGLFFNALLRVFGISTSLATAVVGGLLVTALVAWTTYHPDPNLSPAHRGLPGRRGGIRDLPGRVHRGAPRDAGDLSLDPFNPAAATGGRHGIFLAVLFGLLAISGFDVISPIAEEARGPGG